MLRDEHLGLLDATEKQRRLAYRSDPDRERFTLGAVVLRLAAAELTGDDPTVLRIDRRCDSCGRQHGRPTVIDRPIHVSVSHSDSCIAVAVTSVAPVGIDVERMTSIDTDELVERVLGPCERLARPEDFFAYWTRKESVVKATGAGLSVRLRDVVVSRPDQAPRLLAYPDATGPTASMADLAPGDGYSAALTVLAPALPEVRSIDAAALLGGPSVPKYSRRSPSAAAPAGRLRCIKPPLQRL